MASKVTAKSMSVEMHFDLTAEECKTVRDSLKPDNKEEITAECIAGTLVVRIRKLGISSLYNVTDDIIRCVEISKKIIGGSL